MEKSYDSFSIFQYLSPMKTLSNENADTLKVSTIMPGWLRVGIGSVGAFICLIVVKELGPALWPLSLLTLFFGAIVLAGTCIGLALIISCVFGPNVTWDFKLGHLVISQELRGVSARQSFGCADFDEVSIETETHDGSPDTFVLKCAFTTGVMLEPLNKRVRAAGSAISILMSASQHFKDPLAHRKFLKSPSFATFVEAQKARDMLVGR